MAIPVPSPERVEIEHGIARVNSIELHYAKCGAGKLLLFLHGFPEFWYAWGKQLPYFASDFLAVAPDMRGYNLSSKPKEVDSYAINHLAADVRELADHFGAKKFYLAGHDWGGAVAWATAIAFPELVEKLVIINAPHPGLFMRELRENPAQQQASQYMRAFQEAGAEEFLSGNDFAALQTTVLQKGLEEGYFTAADREAYLEAWRQPGAIAGGLNYYRAAKIGPPAAGTREVFGGASELPNLKVVVPTLVIWGEKDPYLLPGCLNGIERFVRDLRVERIPDASHWVVHEKPEMVNRLIKKFLIS